MKISLKTYVCGLCGNESQHSTNHYGEIYTPCKVCGNGSLFCKGNEPNGIEAKVNVYRFNIEDSEQLKAYKELKATLKAKGFKLFDCISGIKHGYFDRLREQGTAKIDTSYVFDNQWNTNLGRLHDWYEEIYHNKKIKAGYYLDLSPELLRAREPKKYIVKAYYKGELLGTDTVMGINTATPANFAYNKYTPNIPNFDIWQYKDEITLA